MDRLETSGPGARARSSSSTGSPGLETGAEGPPRQRGGDVPGRFEPNATLARLYPEAAVGGYTQLDGQVEFYTRINALVGPESHVRDVGAGRGQWAVDPMPEISRRLRMLKGRVARVVGTDVDDAVLTNP